MSPKDSEEHRCPVCGNIVGQPQDSLRPNIPNNLRESLEILETVVALAKEVTLLLGKTLDTLQRIRETSPGSKIPEFKSLEEEREYWEARGPLADDHKSEVPLQNTPHLFLPITQTVAICYWCDWISPNAEELGEHQETKHPEEWAEHWKHHDGEIKELIHWLDEAATGRRRVIGAREWRKQRS